MLIVLRLFLFVVSTWSVLPAQDELDELMDIIGGVDKGVRQGPSWTLTAGDIVNDFYLREGRLPSASEARTVGRNAAISAHRKTRRLVDLESLRESLECTKGRSSIERVSGFLRQRPKDPVEKLIFDQAEESCETGQRLSAARLAREANISRYEATHCLNKFRSKLLRFLSVGLVVVIALVGSGWKVMRGVRKLDRVPTTRVTATVETADDRWR